MWISVSNSKSFQGGGVENTESDWINFSIVVASSVTAKPLKLAMINLCTPDFSGFTLNMHKNRCNNIFTIWFTRGMQIYFWTTAPRILPASIVSWEVLGIVVQNINLHIIVYSFHQNKINKNSALLCQMLFSTFRQMMLSLLGVTYNGYFVKKCHLIYTLGIECTVDAMVCCERTAGSHFGKLMPTCWCVCFLFTLWFIHFVHHLCRNLYQAWDSYRGLLERL